MTRWDHDPIAAYWLGRHVANVALGAFVLLALGALCLLAALFSGGGA